jgi:hypothetical protein
MLSIPVHTETLNPYLFATSQGPLEVSTTLNNWPGGYLENSISSQHWLRLDLKHKSLIILLYL